MAPGDVISLRINEQRDKQTNKSSCADYGASPLSEGGYASEDYETASPIATKPDISGHEGTVTRTVLWWFYICGLMRSNVRETGEAS